MKLFFFLLLLSSQAFALNWFDLEAGKNYTLKQSFQLPQKERSGSMLEFSQGDVLTLKEIIGLGMGLGLFNFSYPQCPGPQMETDVEIIPVSGTATEIGAMAAEGCELWIYVELKDFWTPSLLEVR